MKSFIVTFYRHGGKENPEMVLGTIEEAGVSGENRFTSMDELYGYFGRAKEMGKKKMKKERAVKGGPVK